SDVDFVRTEAGNRQSDPVAVLAGAGDVEGWVAVLRLSAEAVLERIEEPIEAYRRAAIGGQIKCSSHFQILLIEQSGHERRREPRADALCPTRPVMASGTDKMRQRAIGFKTR